MQSSHRNLTPGFGLVGVLVGVLGMRSFLERHLPTYLSMVSRQLSELTRVTPAWEVEESKLEINLGCVTRLVLNKTKQNKQCHDLRGAADNRSQAQSLLEGVVAPKGECTLPV